jgi:ribosomal protein S18 acetylase RimI-like enzyme
MKITRFSKDKTDRCIEIFLTNKGKFFDASELKMFSAFLKNEKLIRDFYVIESSGTVFGCGGFEKSGTEQVDLVWGMIHQDYHRRGFGRALLLFRLQKIDARFGNISVRVETSQHTSGFFEKHGFVIRSTKTDGFGSGIDYVLMTRNGEPGGARMAAPPRSPGNSGVTEGPPSVS